VPLAFRSEGTEPLVRRGALEGRPFGPKALRKGARRPPPAARVWGGGHPALHCRPSLQRLQRRCTARRGTGRSASRSTGPRGTGRSARRSLRHFWRMMSAPFVLGARMESASFYWRVVPVFPDAS
jgi:hypothetical protein